MTQNGEFGVVDFGPYTTQNIVTQTGEKVKYKGSSNQFLGPTRESINGQKVGSESAPKIVTQTGENKGEIPPSSRGYFQGPLFSIRLSPKLAKVGDKSKLRDRDLSDPNGEIENDSKYDSNINSKNVNDFDSNGVPELGQKTNSEIWDNKRVVAPPKSRRGLQKIWWDMSYLWVACALRVK